VRLMAAARSNLVRPKKETTTIKNRHTRKTGEGDDRQKSEDTVPAGKLPHKKSEGKGQVEGQHCTETRRRNTLKNVHSIFWEIIEERGGRRRRYSH